MTLIACSWPHSQVPNPLAFPGPPSDPDSLEGARSLAQHGQHFEQCEPGNRIGVCLIVTTAVPQVWQSAGAWRVLKQSAGPGERASKCGRESRAFVIYDALRGNVSAVHGAGLRHFPLIRGGRVAHRQLAGCARVPRQTGTPNRMKRLRFIGKISLPVVPQWAFRAYTSANRHAQ
jgi:hypothetical protein